MFPYLLYIYVGELKGERNVPYAGAKGSLFMKKLPEETKFMKQTP